MVEGFLKLMFKIIKPINIFYILIIILIFISSNFVISIIIDYFKPYNPPKYWGNPLYNYAYNNKSNKINEKDCLNNLYGSEAKELKEQKGKKSCLNIIKNSYKKFNLKVTPLLGMNLGRDIDQKTILLKNGKVFIIGGDNSDEYVSVELYNPKTKTFKLIEQNISKYLYKKLNSTYNTPILLKNGNVLIYSMVFDINKEKFVLPKTPEELNFLKYLSLISSKYWLQKNNLKFKFLFKNGQALVIKKYPKENKHSSVLLVDPNKIFKYKEGRIDYKRPILTSYYLKKDLILILFDDSCIIYNPIKGQTKILDEITAPEFTIPLLLNNNKVLLISYPKSFIIEKDYSLKLIIQNNEYIYPYNCSNYDISSVLLNNGNLLILFYGRIYIFDSKTNLFNEVRDGRFFNYSAQKTTLLQDGCILITGGRLNTTGWNRSENSAFILDFFNH